MLVCILGFVDFIIITGVIGFHLKLFLASEISIFVLSIFRTMIIIIISSSNDNNHYHYLYHYHHYPYSYNFYHSRIFDYLAIFICS